jgi:pimeloyl-ACP methyl ester carboxylesterase
MAFADSGGTRIYYKDRGKGEPVFLCLPGWCVHHPMFGPTAERLSTSNRVLAMDWRGHGKSEPSAGDFGYADMLADVLAVIESSGAQSLIPVAQAHAGWVALALRQQLSDRVPKLIFTSWNPISASGNEFAPMFMAAMEAFQDEARWRGAVDQLVASWLTGAPAAVESEIRDEVQSHGYGDWARAAREIVAAYAREGDPLKSLSNFSPPVLALHLYAQPRTPEYLSLQESFAREHPWFAVRRLEGVSHFPTLEVPDETTEAITNFMH